jgi:23S rRNA G2445 N2-methylase RlmL
MQRLNAKESRAALSDILRREFEPFQKKLLSGYYSDAASYEQDLRAAFRPTLQERYSERIDLPLLELDLYTERRIVEGVKAFEKRTR